MESRQACDLFATKVIPRHQNSTDKREIEINNLPFPLLEVWQFLSYSKWLFGRTSVVDRTSFS